MSRLKPYMPTTLNSGLFFSSLCLISLSSAIFYLTPHGMSLMNLSFPAGRYEWYRGQHGDSDPYHKVTLKYDTSNEGLILTGAAVACLAGIMGLQGSIEAFRVRPRSYSHPPNFPTTISKENLISLIVLAATQTLPLPLKINSLPPYPPLRIRPPLHPHLRHILLRHLRNRQQLQMHLGARLSPKLRILLHP